MSFNVHTYAEDSEARKQRLNHPQKVSPPLSGRRSIPRTEFHPSVLSEKRPAPVTAWIDTRPEPKYTIDMALLPRARPAGASVLEEVAAKTGFSVADLKGPRRFKGLVKARQEACWEIRMRFPDYSLPMIGNLLGGRDHTTILHGIRQHEKRLLAEAME